MRFKDARLGRRYAKLLKRMGNAMGESIPLVCQDWANTKAAYRFFASERVSQADILGGHFQSTRDRFAATSGPILILHDTTEFTYQREQPALIGSTKSVNSGNEGWPGEVAVKGLHRVEIGDGKGGTSQAILEIRYRRIQVLPPIGKQERYPALDLTVIHAKERDAPKGRKPIDWKLITDLPVRSNKDAIEKLNWYAVRWKIKVFHKILKSGCKAEDAKLRTAQPLANLISVFCMLSWRVFWMTMMNRATQSASPKLALTEMEITLLDNLVRDPGRSLAGPKALPHHYLTKIARLGGYLVCASDPPPGNKVIWKGLSRLTDIELGAIIGARLVGN
jgi:hypothetical protein